MCIWSTEEREPDWNCRIRHHQNTDVHLTPLECMKSAGAGSGEKSAWRQPEEPQKETKECPEKQKENWVSWTSEKFEKRLLFKNKAVNL